MSTVLRSRNARGIAVLIYVAIGVFAAVMYVGAPNVPLAGSRIGVALALALAIGPIVFPLTVARPIAVLLALWALLVPFDKFFTFGGIGPVEKLLGSAIALAAILCMLVRRRGFIPDVSVAIWGAFALLAIASLLWAPNPDHGIDLLQQIVGLLLVGIFVCMVPADTTDLKAMFCGVVGGGVAASIYGLVAFAKTGHTFNLGDPQSLIDHNHFGAAMLFPLLAATMGAISAGNRWVRLTCAVAAFVCLGGIGISESRGAMIAFGLGLLYILLRSRHRWRLLPWAASLPILLAAVPGVASRFSSDQVSDGTGRFEIWQIGFAAFKHHWFAGNGYGTFRDAYQAAFLEFSQQSSTAQRVQDSHNLIVEIAVELGIVGLVLVLSAWWFQFRALRIIGSAGGWSDVRVGMEAATVAMFAMSMSVDLMMYKYTWLVFFSAWVVRAAYVSATSRRQGSEQSLLSAASEPAGMALRLG